MSLVLKEYNRLSTRGESTSGKDSAHNRGTVHESMCENDDLRLSASPKRNFATTLSCRGGEELGIPRAATDEARIVFLRATKDLPVAVQQMIWHEVAYHSIPACPPPTPRKKRSSSNAYIRSLFRSSEK
tara:strand:+ start:3279 stop:3665 length:387 start_codon:yes stop_codon:yes gene_type:complete